MIVKFETNEREFLDWEYVGVEYRGAIFHEPYQRENLGYKAKLIKPRTIKPNSWYITQAYRSISYWNSRSTPRTIRHLTYIPFKTNKNAEFPKRVTHGPQGTSLLKPKSLRECTVKIRPDFKELLNDFGLHCSFRIIRITKHSAHIQWTLNTKQVDIDEFLKAIKSFCPRTENVIRKAIINESK
jgi:hypothetical protein